jgi:prepilin-type N-terminal cleavage/methylation domain-containing protein
MNSANTQRGLVLKGSKGFTLIELLVVIAIIGLLASIVLASLNGARMKARDTQRIADLHEIDVAIQFYANDNRGAYPPCGAWANSTDSSWNCLVNALAPYLKVPVDPVNNFLGPWSTGNYSFAYAVSPNGQDYDLVGQLEDTTNPDRCQVKNWFFHYYGPYSWCNNYGYSPYLFEDH